MAEMGVSGVASGIDWDSMITKLIEKAKEPALVQVAKKEKLQARADYYDEFLVALRGLQSTLSPLKLASTFKAKEVTADRLDSNASAKGVLTATANADAEVNVHEIEVLQIAKAQINRSTTFTGAIGAVNGNTDSYFYVNAGGQQVKVDFRSIDTVQTLSDKINTALQNSVPPVEVTASVVDNKLILKSNNTGLGTKTMETTLTRAASGNDVLTFYTVPGNTNSESYTINAEKAGGTFKITKGTASYTEGKDFDIVNGNEVRWRTSSYSHVPPDDTYQIKYSAYGSAGPAGEVYTLKAAKWSGSIDLGLSEMKSSEPFDIDRVTVRRGNTVYVEGTDYTFDEDTKYLVWLDGGKKPAEGLEYTIEYKAAAGGEEFTFDVQRNGLDAIATNPPITAFDGKTVTITSGTSRTYNQGADFDVVRGASGNAAIRWKAYDAPAPGSAPYDIALDGTNTYTGTRQADDAIDLSANFSAWDIDKINSVEYGSVTFAKGTDYNVNGSALTWSSTGKTIAASTAPTGDYNVEYTYNTGTFTLTDDGNGALNALGLFSDVTYAQDAMIVVNGETLTRSSNKLTAGGDNELIKGVTLELRGPGSVSIDIEQDANGAVEAINAFMTSYNDIMSWINTRLTEKELDEDKKATIDSDDFRWNWGVLSGSSLLRNAKNSLRQLTSNLFAPTFTSRTSRGSVFTPMTQEGTFTVTVGERSLDVQVKAGDTMADIRDAINSMTTYDGQENPLQVDDSGRAHAYVQATLTDGKLKISCGTDSKITLGGSTDVLAEMQMNFEYTALSQVGLKLPSSGGGGITDAAKIGQLEFDTTVFMEALENNADDVAQLFTTFSAQMQTYMDDMVKTSQKEVGGVTMIQGTVAREIDNINNQIDSINKYLADFERRLQDKEAALVTQFSAAEVSLSKLMQQASWLDSVKNQLQSGKFG